jgi:hypothetical protein
MQWWNNIELDNIELSHIPLKTHVYIVHSNNNNNVALSAESDLPE